MARCFAMQLDRPAGRLHRVDRPLPSPGPRDVLITVRACGVCRTDLHVMDGEVAATYPIVPGHEIVGEILALGSEVTGFAPGERVGVPWLGGTCGYCPHCRGGRENLCDHPVFTGATRDGGYATHLIADARYCLRLPERYSDVEAAPLLCAGLIGHRALTLAGEDAAIGLYGFGAAAHILAQLLHWQGRRTYAFTRPGDMQGQAFARNLGCIWAGPSDVPPPKPLDAAIIFAPVGPLVPLALAAVRKGGRVVCAGIHMSDIPTFPYAALWGERSIHSVANLTREDGRAFMALAARVPIRVETNVFALEDANDALDALRTGRVKGAVVLVS